MSILRTILVIEDDDVTRMAFSIRLGASGYHVVLASDATSGFSAALRERPALILLDLGLPGGGGLTVLKRIRTIPALSGVPVVVVSAHDAATHAPRALEAGAVAYLAKPVDNDELLGIIKAHIPSGGGAGGGVAGQAARSKILIVEDDADLRLAMRVRLESSGYQIVQAADAATALLVAHRERPALVLLDLGLPAGDGLKVLERLRANDGGVPVIVLSGRDAATTRKLALERGASAYFQKPAQDDELLATIKSAIGG